jgi:hypothetical protein
MTDWIDYIPELHAKLVKQNFGPNDSQIVSSIMHPAEAINRGGEWIRHNVSQAAGGDPYDNPNPLYGPSKEQQAQAGMNIAGLAQLGSMPGSPKSSGGTLGSTVLNDYVGHHKAPVKSDSTVPLHNLIDIFGDDIYSNNAVRYYGTGAKYDNESINVMKMVRDNPDKLVTVYRAVPKEIPENSINAGDWVTLSKTYAKEHAISHIDGKSKIIQQKVPAKYLFTNGDSIHELGYDPYDILPETEYSIAHKIAQKNASLPIEKGGLGLPRNNTAMDRAKAMGFLKPYYHGTNTEINDIKTKIPAKKRIHGSGKINDGVFWVTTSQEGAGHFANMAAAKQATGKTSDALNIVQNIEKNGFDFDSPENLANYGENYIAGQNIIPLTWSGKRYSYDVTDNFNAASPTKRRKAVIDGISRAKDAGLDAARFNGVSDPIKQDTMAIINPSSLRSRFAAFDPMKKDSANILASTLAGTALAKYIIDDDEWEDYTP